MPEDPKKLAMLRHVRGGLTEDKLKAMPAFGKLSREGQDEAVEQRYRAEDLLKRLTALGFNVAKPMNYGSQLILLLDEDLEVTATPLQRKRVVAGDGGKSFLYDFTKGVVTPEPEGRKFPQLTETARIYVVGHCDPGSKLISYRAWDVGKLAQELRELLTACSVTKVARISLVACFSGGNPAGSDARGNYNLAKITAYDSFAFRLYEMLKDITAQVSAYAETVAMDSKIHDGAAIIAARKVTNVGPNEVHKGHERKIVFFTNAQGRTDHRYELGSSRR